MRSKSSTASSIPSAPISFTPLYSGGLWEAVIITAGTDSRPAYDWAPGVGTAPSRSTSAPTLASPLAAASASIRPVARVSRATATRSARHTVPAALATFSTNSGVSASLATPRVPLDPNTFMPVGADRGAKGIPETLRSR
jgi:hypothetical protein